MHIRTVKFQLTSDSTEFRLVCIVNEQLMRRREKKEIESLLDSLFLARK